ncbi:MAG TPA: YjbF family lipoprotein [Paracoccaceae bacterium]|nr:YjbF family lipoprotein [Paracoccaceae bacterium]
MTGRASALRRAAVFGAFLAVAAAAGCSSLERTPTGAVIAAVRGGFVDPPPPAQPTRAEVEALGFATIAARFSDEGPRAFLVAAAVAEDYVTYSAADRRNLILHGAAVSAIRGVGSGLVSHASGPGPDPLVTRMPLEAWPSRLVRTWRFSDALGRETVRAAECRPRAVEAERVEILERRYDLVRVEERCTTSTGSFVNLHWVEPESGFVWKTRQWIGERTPPVWIEIVTPFG